MNLLQVGDYSAWISIDGLATEIYGVERSHNVLSCWIASEIGKVESSLYDTNYHSPSNPVPFRTSPLTGIMQHEKSLFKGSSLPMALSVTLMSCWTHYCIPINHTELVSRTPGHPTTLAATSSFRQSKSLVDTLVYASAMFLTSYFRWWRLPWYYWPSSRYWHNKIRALAGQCPESWYPTSWAPIRRSSYGKSDCSWTF